MSRRLSLVALIAWVALSGALPARAADVTVDWSRTPPLSGRVIGDEVRIPAGPSGGIFPLTVIEHPSVQRPGYAVTGAIRYRGVEGNGYLEMWSVFPDRSRYFSRTLAASGPMAALSGTSGRRAFELPFQLTGGDVPTRLEIDVVLQGVGTVWVGPLRMGPLASAVGTTGGWWSGRQAGLFGGIAGGLLGVLGGVIGWAVSRRRARRFALGAMRTAVVAGLLCVVIGVIAVVASQPYAVYFPLLLLGTIQTLVFGSNLRAARRAYADAELRRMRAMDSV